MAASTRFKMRTCILACDAGCHLHAGLVRGVTETRVGWEKLRTDKVPGVNPAILAIPTHTLLSSRHCA